MSNPAQRDQALGTDLQKSYGGRRGEGEGEVQKKFVQGKIKRKKFMHSE